MPKSTAALFVFLLTPLREGRLVTVSMYSFADNFYSRPCGRGDFVLVYGFDVSNISTHAPAGGATVWQFHKRRHIVNQFLLTPLREGRQQFSTSPS